MSGGGGLVGGGGGKCSRRGARTWCLGVSDACMQPGF